MGLGTTSRPTSTHLSQEDDHHLDLRTSTLAPTPQRSTTTFGSTWTSSTPTISTVPPESGGSSAAASTTSFTPVKPTSLSGRISSVLHLSHEPYNVSASPRSQVISAFHDLHTGPPPKLLPPRAQESSTAASTPPLVDLMDRPRSSLSWNQTAELYPSLDGRAPASTTVPSVVGFT